MAPISGSSRKSRRSWAVAGAAWQGRRPAGIPLGFQGSRTPSGGDQRPIQGRRDLREGPLMPTLLWEPPAEMVERALMTRYMREQGKRDYEELWRWSVDDLDGFW